MILPLPHPHLSLLSLLIFFQPSLDTLYPHFILSSPASIFFHETVYAPKFVASSNDSCFCFSPTFSFPFWCISVCNPHPFRTQLAYYSCWRAILSHWSHLSLRLQRRHCVCACLHAGSGEGEKREREKDQHLLMIAEAAMRGRRKSSKQNVPESIIDRDAGESDAWMQVQSCSKGWERVSHPHEEWAVKERRGPEPGRDMHRTNMASMRDVLEESVRLSDRMILEMNSSSLLSNKKKERK